MVLKSNPSSLKRSSIPILDLDDFELDTGTFSVLAAIFSKVWCILSNLAVVFVKNIVEFCIWAVNGSPSLPIEPKVLFTAIIALVTLLNPLTLRSYKALLARLEDATM